MITNQMLMDENATSGNCQALPSPRASKERRSRVSKDVPEAPPAGSSFETPALRAPQYEARGGLAVATSEASPERKVTGPSPALSGPARQHAQQHAVAPEILMPERARDVQPDEGEQAVRQQLMNLLGGMEDRPVRRDAEIQLEETIVKHPAMPDIGDDPDRGDGQHQNVHEMVRPRRCAPPECADARGHGRRPVGRPPPEPRDHQRKINQADRAMHVDPERPRRLRDIVEQEAKAAQEHDQRGEGPMKSNRADVIALRRRQFVSHPDAPESRNQRKTRFDYERFGRMMAGLGSVSVEHALF